MEWVETTGKTIDEAKEAALDELGVDEQDAEFEVLAEPKVGLFGRLRSEGRVRARVRPTTPRAKEDRRDRRRRNKSAAGSDEAATPEPPRDKSNSDRSPAGGGRQGAIKSAASSGSSAAGEALTPTAPGAEDDAASATPGGGSRPGRSRSRRRNGAGQSPTALDSHTADSHTAGSDTADSHMAGSDGPTDRTPKARRPARPRSDAATPRASHADRNDDEVVTEGVDMDVALEEQGDVATAFLNGLVERFGLTADIDVQQPDDDTLHISLTGGDLGLLIGPKGATLLSVQDLTRTVVQRQTGAGNGRIYVDVSGYRQKRGEALARFTTKVAADVQASQQRVALEPMSAPDRKVVHDTATAIAGVTTLSEGEEPRRRVVIIPTED